MCIDINCDCVFGITGRRLLKRVSNTPLFRFSLPRCARVFSHNGLAPRYLLNFRRALRCIIKLSYMCVYIGVVDSEWVWYVWKWLLKWYLGHFPDMQDRCRGKYNCYIYCGYTHSIAWYVLYTLLLAWLIVIIGHGSDYWNDTIPLCELYLGMMLWLVFNGWQLRTLE